MGWGWDWYPKPKPRRPANGIRAQSKQFGKTWWASKWLGALEQLVDTGRLQRGRSYARSGQVLNIDIRPGRVDSRVQGSRPQPYKVWIEIKPLSDREWEQATDAMSAQAIFAAKLLAGEMPQNIEEAFAAAQVSLFPTSRGDLETECSCPDWANPCKHIAAVYYLLGEQFDADPFLLFRLRGRSKDEIVEMLRARRSAAAAVPEDRPAEKRRTRQEKAIPLKKCLDDFWEGATSLQDFHVEIKNAPVDAAPVKRLGAPGFWHGKQDFVAAFADAYRDIAEAALNVVHGTKD